MADNTPSTPPIPRLGDLEVAVLEHIWQKAETSAKEAHAALGAERGISANTVQSTLERLYRKGLLSRAKAGHAFLYRARVAREQVVAGLINEVLGRFGADTASAVAAFAEAADGFDDESLQALEAELKLLRQRKTSP